MPKLLSPPAVPVPPPPVSAKNYLNLDKAVTFSVRTAYQAMRGWLRGRPLDEVALMSRLVEKLVYNPCPPWRSPAYFLDRRLFLLHRKGKKQVDKYGADLAVTVNIFDGRAWNGKAGAKHLFSKTALFQLKKGDNYEARLTRAQLLQAGIFTNRSFVLYAHETAGEYRIKASTELLAEFTEPGQQSKKFDAQDWYTLSEWLVLWLTCQQGIPSDDASRIATEAQLTAQLVEAKKESLTFFVNGFPIDRSSQTGANNERAELVQQGRNSANRLPTAWVDIDLAVPILRDQRQ